jgi:peptide/nickel transport system permease protein
VAEKLRRRAPITFLVCALALFGSITLSIPIGAIGAWRKGRTFDIVSSILLFLLYATPTFAVAEVLRRLMSSPGSNHIRLLLAVVALAVGSLATLSRWQRAAMLEVVRQDFVRTARAKGVPAWRVLVFHALRSSLLPVVTLAGLHLPALLGGAFVVEEVFRLPGIGFETLRAIESHDSAWLMAVLLAAAVAIIFGMIACDIVYGALDPRARDVIVRRRGGLAP